jgi:hypothetical protein
MEDKVEAAIVLRYVVQVAYVFLVRMTKHAKEPVRFLVVIGGDPLDGRNRIDPSDGVCA